MFSYNSASEACISIVVLLSPVLLLPFHLSPVLLSPVFFSTFHLSHVLLSPVLLSLFLFSLVLLSLVLMFPVPLPSVFLSPFLVSPILLSLLHFSPFRVSPFHLSPALLPSLLLSLVSCLLFSSILSTCKHSFRLLSSILFFLLSYCHLSSCLLLSRLLSSCLLCSCLPSTFLQSSCLLLSSPVLTRMSSRYRHFLPHSPSVYIYISIYQYIHICINNRQAFIRNQHAAKNGRMQQIGATKFILISS